MTKAFNLLDEPWLPVRLVDGHTIDLGLLDVFRRSSEIVALAETSPPALVAKYRLLLAILHRALSRAMRSGWSNEDRARWYRSGLPNEEVRDYLEHWRERFWLFHPEYPFMQVAALATAEETCDKRKPWTQISLAGASGNAAVVFDHAWDDSPRAITPGMAISELLGFLQFTPGGLVKTIRDSDKSGPLANTAAIIPMGARLSETLLLALHPSAGRKTDEDLPSWERSPLTLAQLRGVPVVSTGSNDRYTRQSRAVLLLHEDDGDIRWLRFAAGYALGDDDGVPDAMASFRAGSNGLVRMTFNEGKALWRDLPALVPNPAGTSRPAAVLQHALTLHDELGAFGSVNQPLLVAGLASDQAKLLRWRVEQIALPATLLDDEDKAKALRDLVGMTEYVFVCLRDLGTSMLAETMPTPTKKDTISRARDLLDSGQFSSGYFSTAERALPELLRLLGEGRFEQADVVWSAALRKAAKAAWDQVLKGMGYSPRALRADALFRSRFLGFLNKHLPDPEIVMTAKEA